LYGNDKRYWYFFKIRSLWWWFFAHKDIAFDYASLEQLVVLSNMESINALLIRQGLAQRERLVQL